MKNQKSEIYQRNSRSYLLRNPLHNSEFSDIGYKYKDENNGDCLFVGLKGLVSLDSFNEESKYSPFFKIKLDVYAVAEIGLDAPVPQLPGIETKIIDRLYRGQIKEVSLKLNKIGLGFLGKDKIFLNNFTRQFAFERPINWFNKIKIRVYYCEGFMVSPIEHSCDRYDIWQEWPEEPKDDSFLYNLTLKRNESDIYFMITDGQANYLNASSYDWNTNRKYSLAWFIDQYVQGQDVNPSNQLFKMTIDNLTRAKNGLSSELFVYAHQHYFQIALFQIKSHKMKLSHWMWFIFPQMMFKYPSEMSTIYSLDIKRMFEYQKNEYLMKNTEKMLLALLDNDCPANASQVFGRDSEKFRNSIWFFRQFNSSFSYYKEDFALPEIVELFNKVYSKFFLEKERMEDSQTPHNLFSRDNFRHFLLLVKHYNKDSNKIIHLRLI